MKKIMINLTIKENFWYWSMVLIGQFAINLGACPDKICAWVVKYGLRVKVDGH